MKRNLRQKLTRVGNNALLVASLALLVSQAMLAPAHAIQSQADLDADYSWPLYNPSAGTCVGNNGFANPTGTLPKIIPEPYNGAFTKGGNAYHVAPALVAAIFTEENFTHTPTAQLPATWANFPRTHPDPNSGWPTNQFHTMGPFQFIPGTWAAEGVDGNSDGVKDPNNIWDAAASAAHYLSQNGATVDKPTASWQAAIFAYNHAQWYVDAVMVYYQYYTTGQTNNAVPSAAQPPIDCSGAAVNCTANGNTGGNLSTIRTNIVCIAQQQLAIWQSKPGYPNPAYSEYGYKTDPTNYSQGRTEEWCADFVSWVYWKAGDQLQSPDWNVSYVPNIQSIGALNPPFHWHPANSGYTPKPGDLAIHGSNHVNIFISATGTGGNIRTTYIGGDQGSPPYPGGSIVSTEQGSGGYYSNGITGYVSPD
jgi:hypothetical protein